MHEEPKAKREAACLADLELVRQARDGDPAAIETLLERMGKVRGMLAFQNKRLGHPLREQDLEDLVQSTLLAIWVKLGEYSGAGRFASWLAP